MRADQRQAARIFEFMSDRDTIKREVARRVVQDKLRAAHLSRDKALEYILNEAAYLEMQRLEKHSSKLDMRPYGFWHDLARSVGKASEQEKAALLRELTDEYCEDVAGKFTPWVYRFASGLLPLGLSLIFNAQDLQTLFTDFKRLSDRIKIQGPLEQLRDLARTGTLIVVPTHSSNLDSIVVGWTLEEAGLPPVTYGAGKNLFTNPLMSFFMHNLGAYKVDRRLRHKLYKEVLKTYSEVLIERGYHSLFFPGGTRSRDNVVETHLKLGLLGTALTAYTNNLRARRDHSRVFICPLTINYSLVLEAETLMAEALRRDGGARYIIDDDEFSRPTTVAQFVFKSMTMDHTLYMRFGEPIDPFGNPVDARGDSLDPHGRAFNPATYLLRDGEIVDDVARDAEYTRACGRAIARSFKRNTVALTSNFVAYVLFHYVQELYPMLDLYRLLRVIKGELIPYDAIYHRADLLKRKLERLESRGDIALAEPIRSASTPELVEAGARILGMYHTPVVVATRANGLEIDNPNLLYFYSNRLVGFGLEAMTLDEDAVLEVRA